MHVLPRTPLSQAGWGERELAGAEDHPPPCVAPPLLPPSRMLGRRPGPGPRRWWGAGLRGRAGRFRGVCVRARVSLRLHVCAMCRMCSAARRRYNSARSTKGDADNAAGTLLLYCTATCQYSRPGAGASWGRSPGYTRAGAMKAKGPGWGAWWWCVVGCRAETVDEQRRHAYQRRAGRPS